MDANLDEDHPAKLGRTASFASTISGRELASARGVREGVGCCLCRYGEAVEFGSREHMLRICHEDRV